MLELSDAQIGGWLSSFLLPLFRIAAMFMVMPIIGAQLVPARVRLGLALAMTVVLVPVLPSAPQVDALALSTWLLIAQEILIGVLFGFTLQLFFHVFAIAGQIVTTQMGLGFASTIDPTNGISVAVLSQFLLMLVTLLFLAMNGHLVVFEILAESFVTLPLGAGLQISHYGEVAGRLGWVLGAGLLLSLPMVTALLVINIAFGVMTRAAPQLNIFAIGFPLTLVMGLFITWAGTADIFSQYQVLVAEALHWLRELAQAR